MENKLKYKNSKKNYVHSLYGFPKNPKGLSTIVTAVILIALSMAALVVVWGFVSNFINEEIGSSQSCFGNYDKVKLNKQYTCYEALGGGGFNLRFSLSVGDIDIDKVTVLVSSESAVKSYIITNENQTISGLTLYPSGISSVTLPGKNSGISYIATGFNSKIDLIEIAPTIDDNLCEVSDSFSEIDNCAVYVG
ncbi:hypothetical protein M0R72_04735 [Candidatus Pacearchaeota archaeon]|jgi:hypothetical protein|nr:hypothetical protein [Candidatus Pacearchaeota archaeon]